MTKSGITKLQKALKSKGFYLSGRIDGLWGLMTEKAIIAFKKSIGLRARAYVGPITWAALSEDRNTPDSTHSKEPSWLRVARTYLGLREYRGRSHNKTILKWWKMIKLSWIKDDETAWCAAAVGGILEECGIRSSRSAAARSYDSWGRELSRPAVGSIVAFWRGSKAGWKGHVAFVVGINKDGNIVCAGGNQGDAFNIKPFSPNRVLSYRWPANTTERPSYNLPLVDSSGALSQDEA